MLSCSSFQYAVKQYTRKKSLEYTLRAAYNWLTEKKMLPTEFKTMTGYHVKPYFQESVSLYVIDNRHFFSM